MAIDNKLPFYFKDLNPGGPNVSLTSKLYQWDESSNAPSEVLNGMAKMSPKTESTEWILWTDTTTLGYADRTEAPIYFSDGGQGNMKRLQIINHAKNRMGLPMEDNLSDAITWAENEAKVYITTNISIVNTESEDYIDNNPEVVPSGFENYTGHFWTPDGGDNFLTDYFSLLKFDIGSDTQQFHNGLRRGYVGTEDGAATMDYWVKEWQYIPTSTSTLPLYQGARGSETFDMKHIFNYDYSTPNNPRTWTLWGGGTGGYANTDAFINLGGEAGGEMGRSIELTYGLNDRNGNAITNISSLYPGMVVRISIPALNTKKHYLLRSISTDSISAQFGGGDNFDEAYDIVRLGLFAISPLTSSTGGAIVPGTDLVPVRTGYDMNVNFMRNFYIEGLSYQEKIAYVENYFRP